jgi:hypothetical protein
VIGAVVGAGLLAVLVIVGIVALASGGGDDGNGGSGANGAETTTTPEAETARQAAAALPGLTQKLTVGISDLRDAAQREITLFNQTVECTNNALAAVPQNIDALVACFDNTAAFQEGADTETASVSALAVTLSEADKTLQAAQSDPNAGSSVTSAVANATPTIEKARGVVDLGTQLCDCDGRLIGILTRLRDAAGARDAGTFNAAAAELNAEKTTRNALFSQLIAA